MTLQEALDFLGGARFENYSGQVIAEHANENKDFILCELSCTCSEVASRNADEYGEALITLLNSVKGLLDQQGVFTRMIAEVCDHMESLIEEAERLVGDETARMRDIKQAAVDACQSVQDEIEAGAAFVNIPLAIASRMALAWLDIETR